jgi:regulator of RNase E activity RraA
LLVGDGEGVVVVPRSIAEEMVEEAYEHDQLEEFLMSRILGGASILGVYPPDAETLRQYEASKRGTTPV